MNQNSLFSQNALDNIGMSSLGLGASDQFQSSHGHHMGYQVNEMGEMAMDPKKNSGVDLDPMANLTDQSSV
jgi:hypothetical protein